LFKWAEKLNEEGYLYEGVLYTFKCLFPADLKAAWQASDMGGGSATTNLPCFLCDEKKCNKSCLKTPACQDCTDRLKLTSCRHVAFCHGDAAPVSICQSLVHANTSNVSNKGHANTTQYLFDTSSTLVKCS
jgi:hypothetical protein